MSKRNKSASGKQSKVSKTKTGKTTAKKPAIKQPATTEPEKKTIAKTVPVKQANPRHASNPFRAGSTVRSASG